MPSRRPTPPGFEDAQSVNSHRNFFASYLDDVSEHPDIIAYKQRVMDIIQSLAPNSLLDVGCGRGADTAFRQALRPTLIQTGVDHAPQLALPGLEIRAGDITNLPFSNGAFDIVVCDRVLQHVDDHQSAIRELLRVFGDDKQARVIIADTRWDLLTLPGHESLTERLREHYLQHLAGATSVQAIPDLLAQISSRHVQTEKWPLDLVTAQEVETVIGLQRITGKWPDAEQWESIAKKVEKASLTVELHWIDGPGSSSQ